jgi:hypothetical protein
LQDIKETNQEEILPAQQTLRHKVLHDTSQEQMKSIYSFPDKVKI